MTKAYWKKKIKLSCKKAGTYRPFFDSVIDTLAGILETRDKAQEQFEESGSETVISRTNSSGVENLAKNPALVVILDCNSQALAYWRDLGLTPAGLRKLNEKALKEPEKTDSFASILSGLEV